MNELLALARCELGRLEKDHAQAVIDFAASRKEKIARIDALRAFVQAFADTPETANKQKPEEKIPLDDCVSSIVEVKPETQKGWIAEATAASIVPQERPVGLSSFDMIKQALEATDAPMTATEIVKWIVDNIWAGCPASFSGSPYGLCGHGKLERKGQKFVLAEKKKEPPPASVIVAPPKVETPVPSKEIITHPQHRPKPPPPPQPKQFASADGKRSFEYGGIEVMLPVKWWRLVNKLLTAMGKGYLPATTVVVAAFGTERMPIMPQEWLASERFGINEALEPTQLMMMIEKAGVFLKRRDA